MHPFVVETIRQARRLIIAVVGGTLVLIGIVMIVTPGPGWLVILLGLSVLAAEFVWARRLLRRLKRKGAQIGGAILGKVRTGAPPASPAGAPPEAP
jgi:uncharacterized protein (TIGR02611 family)